jgi:hypothetical protein
VVAIEAQAPLEVVAALVEPCRRHRQKAKALDEPDVEHGGLAALAAAIQSGRGDVLEKVGGQKRAERQVVRCNSALPCLLAAATL